MKGEGDKTRLSRDEPGGVMPLLGLKSIAQLECIHTSAHSMGKKQEEQEATVQQGSCDRVSIRETWGVTHDRSDDKVECPWESIRGKADQAHISVGVCYRPLSQDEEADELF